MHENAAIAHGSVKHMALSYALLTFYFLPFSYCRQCDYRHIMMDATPLYPHLYDPTEPTMRRDQKGTAKPRSRTAHPVRYYFVDFSHAVRTADGVNASMSKSETRARYAKDVFDLANVIRRSFIDVCSFNNFSLRRLIEAVLLEIRWF
jgi:hypothetical protein